MKFLIIAAVLMFLVDHFIWDGERPYMAKIKNDYLREKLTAEMKTEPTLVLPEDGSEYFEAPEDFGQLETDEQSSLPHSLPIEEEKDEEVKMTMPFPYEVPKTPKMNNGGKPKIAIVIDDVGMNVEQSRAAINLPSQVTLAFLPYAETVRELAAKASSGGHEIIIHAPMEAMDSNKNLGPMALRSDMDYASFAAELDKMTKSFEGYVGVNNHMGSRLTQNPESMGYLMDQLKQRQLYFLDSRTIATSVAADMANTYGIPYATRDVFLDHEETPKFVKDALKKLEETARRKGHAIAIGHPKEVTMKELKKWVKTVEAKGFELVPVSELLNGPTVRVVKRNSIPAPVKTDLSEIAPAAGEVEALANPSHVQPRPLQLQ